MNRRSIHIPIDGRPDKDNYEVQEERKNLIRLLKENTQRIVVDDNNDCLHIITNCHDELFRNSEIEIIAEEKRKDFVTKIGESLFRFFIKNQYFELNSTLRETKGEKPHLILDFEKAFINKNKSLSFLPWEYLRCPRDIDQSKQGFRLTDKTIIIRSTTKIHDESTKRISPKVSHLKVLIVIPEDFALWSNEDKKKHSILEVLEHMKKEISAEEKEIKITIYSFKNADFSSKSFRRLLKTGYNIIHFIGNAQFKDDKGYLLFPQEEKMAFAFGEDNLISNLQQSIAKREEDEEDALYCVIFQSSINYPPSTYHAFTAISNFLSEIKVPSVCAIPYGLGNDAGFYSERIKDFYLELYQGTTIGEVVDNLGSELLDDDNFGLPILYLSVQNFSLINSNSPYDSAETRLNDVVSEENRMQKNEVQLEKLWMDIVNNEDLKERLARDLREYQFYEAEFQKERTFEASERLREVKLRLKAYGVAPDQLLAYSKKKAGIDFLRRLGLGGLDSSQETSSMRGIQEGLTE